MQHFDNLDHYTEQDFDDYTYYSRGSKKPYYEEETKQFYFVYEDTCGYEQELFTTIDCVWKVVPPDPTTWASDWDYHGYVELKSWEVISVEDHEGNEVKPEEVLTEKQLLAYTQGLEEFVES